VHITQKTNYPWDGLVTISLDVNKPADLTLKLRTPAWLGEAPLPSDLYQFAPRAASMTSAGYPVPGGPGFRYETFDSPQGVLPADGWHNLRQTLAPGRSGGVTLRLPMPVRRVLAHANVKDDAGKAAIQRGPLVYALEGVDNGGKVLDASVPLDATFTPVFKSDLLGGVTSLSTTVSVAAADGTRTNRTITAIPYFAWANRGRGEMAVWIKY
jgi:DUF1680 family protein